MTDYEYATSRRASSTQAATRCLEQQMSHFIPMLPDEQPSPEQIALFRAMSGERRLQLAEELYWSARKMKAAGVRSHHPDWAEERVNAEVRRIFLHARS